MQAGGVFVFILNLGAPTQVLFSWQVDVLRVLNFPMGEKPCLFEISSWKKCQEKERAERENGFMPGKVCPPFIAEKKTAVPRGRERT